MASKTSIPRFLLPQYGAIWRSTARTTAFPRPLRPELGLVLVRFASKSASTTASSTLKSTTATTSKTAAAKKVTAPKAASTKAAPTKTTAARASATKTVTSKTTPAKAATTKTPATKAATPKTPSTQPAAKVTATTTTTTTAAPAAKTSVPPVAAPKAATPDPSKPLILEKPEKFNPPSHGSRLPRSTPKHYGGGPTTEEVQIQKTKEYPGLPPPPNTWAHWFLNNRQIHLFITLGTLLSLCGYTFIARFNATSPYADLIPPASEFLSHPIDYIGACLHVLRLHEEHISAETAEKRRRRVEDVAKRTEYRKAHGLNTAQGIESWTRSSQAADTADASLPANNAA